MADSAAQQPRLKIAVLNRVFASTGGGAERYSIAVVEQLAARHEIHVFAQEIEHAWPGVSYHRIACLSPKPRWLNQLWYAFATWRATRRGFDIVHSHENVWHGQVHTMHVKTVKRSLLEGQKGYQRVLRWLKIVLSPRLITYLTLEARRVSAHKGTAVVAVSQSLQDELVAQYPACAPHVQVITPGVTLPATTLAPQQAREQLDLPPEGAYALFVANDYARKGLATLLQALQGLPELHLLVVGHPGQIVRFKALASQLDMSDRVHFLGSLHNMQPAYAAATMLVHPTLEDSFAMVVLEAMAHRLPVVVSGSAYCGISSLLDHEQNALLIDDPHNAAALQQMVSTVLRDPFMAERLREQGYAFAVQHSWQCTAAAYEQLFYELVRKTATPPA